MIEVESVTLNRRSWVQIQVKHLKNHEIIVLLVFPTCGIDESRDEDDWEENEEDGDELPRASPAKIFLYSPLAVLTGRIRAGAAEGGQVGRDWVGRERGHVAVAEAGPEAVAQAAAR